MLIREHGLGRLGVGLGAGCASGPAGPAWHPGCWAWHCSCPLLSPIKAWKDRVTFCIKGVGLPNHGLKSW